MCQAKSPIKTLDEIKIDRIEGWSGDEFRFQLRAKVFFTTRFAVLLEL